MVPVIFAHLQRLAADLSRISGSQTSARELLDRVVAGGAHVLWELSADDDPDRPRMLDVPRDRPRSRIKLVVEGGELVERACRLEPDAILIRCMFAHGRSAESAAELRDQMSSAATAISIAKGHGIKVALCIPPALAEVETAHLLGADQVSLHTGEYARLRPAEPAASQALDRLKKAAVRAHELGLEVAVGHGLTLQHARAAAHVGVVAEIHVGAAFAGDAHELGVPTALAQLREAVA